MEIQTGIERWRSKDKKSLYVLQQLTAVQDYTYHLLQHV